MTTDDASKDAAYDPRKDPKAGCMCWLTEKFDFPHEHIGYAIVRWDFGPDMPYEDAARRPSAADRPGTAP